MARKKKEAEKPTNEWLGTYGDMITLMLCFFVMLYNPSEVDIVQLESLNATLQGEPDRGGVSLSSGRLSDMGNNINALPSVDKGKTLGPTAIKAVSLFTPDIKSNKITITSDERGIVITLASDAFFAPGSAELNLDETRETLIRLSRFLASGDLKGRKFRVEGHTDDTTPPSQWKSNWELSSARAINVLTQLADYGVDENRFSVAGYADTRPKFSNDTEEGRSYNRRVDIIILDEGHF
ncbi:MAG: flagellar motor protein MotB [Spirochaetaceae bacterium]|jgi:chemotaxis protein MotB|nr:flagellar motor protein MotB [Spirochaetaceae bacterium]